MSGYEAAKKKVNIEGLQVIESEDTFEVSIGKMEIERSTSTIRFGDCDYLLLTIKNNLDEDIVGIGISLIAYDQDGVQVEIGNGFGSISGINTPQMFSAKTTIKEHSEETLILKCNSEKFSGVRAIISSYTKMGGTVVENESAEEWYSIAYSNQKMEIIDFDEEQEWSNAVMIPGETVNVETLKAIEKTDSFPVTVMKKRIRKNAGDGMLTEELLTLKIVNGTDDDIFNPIVYIISFDKDTKPCSLGFIKSDFPYVQVLSFKENDQIRIAAHSEQTCKMPCHLGNIVGIRAIVASYEDASGVLHENSSAAKWLEQMLNSNKFELD